MGGRRLAGGEVQRRVDVRVDEMHDLADRAGTVGHGLDDLALAHHPVLPVLTHHGGRVVHHLAVDVITWRILLEDLQAATLEDVREVMGLTYR